jgi:hypothetical protein
MFIPNQSKIFFCILINILFIFFHRNAYILPSPYVTYSTADSHHLCRTQILTSTCKPIWNYQQSVKLAVEHLFNEKKTFILKVWHKVNADIETIPGNLSQKLTKNTQIDLFYRKIW